MVRNRINKLIFAVIILILLSTVGFFYYDRVAYSVSGIEAPLWLRKIILNENPEFVDKCVLDGEVRYYVMSACCDFFNSLYDKRGNELCQDGGVAGGGNCRGESWQKVCSKLWTSPEVVRANELQKARAAAIKPPGPAHDLMVKILRALGVTGFIFKQSPLEWNTGQYESLGGKSVKVTYQGNSYEFPRRPSDEPT